MKSHHNFDNNNIDSLINDIDNVLTDKSYSYNIPRRPSIEKTNSVNPKIKFAHEPLNSSNNLLSTPIIHNHSNNSSNSKNHLNDSIDSNKTFKLQSITPVKDNNSIDHLFHNSSSPNIIYQPNNLMNNPFNNKVFSPDTMKLSESFYSSYGLSNSFSSTNVNSNTSATNTTTNDVSIPQIKSNKQHTSIADDFDSPLTTRRDSYTNIKLPNNFDNKNEYKSNIFNNHHKLYNINQSNNANGKNKCTRVVLSGSSTNRGLKQSAFSKLACDNMRCLKCNFNILCYRNVKWDDSIDYLYLRNNFLNPDKLILKLIESTNYCSYCCQCAWIDTIDDISMSPNDSNQPQWVCMGHN